jgi:predicted dehydrogenase
MDLTPQQIEVGRDNYNMAVGQTRRDFLGAAYFGYSKLRGNPVKVGFIGTGDEGNILLTQHPRDYMEVVAIADIRPTNVRRALHGDGNEHRQGLIKILGEEAASKVRVYRDHKELLADKEIEAVVIAVPLNQHAPLTIEALNAGKHVLCEKLMAKTVAECKEMIQAARKNNRLLAVGHQRHYSVLYENANHLVSQGLLGDIKYIRAQWHRNNSFPNRDQWLKNIPAEDRAALPEEKVREYGYDSLEKLVNWRLYNETGGGLMVELGSHQLDACSIFLGKVHPVAVQGYGGKNFYGIKGVGPEDKWNDRREIWDQIFVTFEFPGPQYEHDQDDICVVTYSSISTNRFEPYGELVYGSRATLIMKEEKEALLYKEETPWSGGGPDQRLYVISAGKEGGPALDSYETGGARAAAAPGTEEDISRGYREEMEHLCHCIREFEGNYYPNGKEIPPKEGGLRCNGVVAMADAIMSLTANMAMAHKVRIPFQEEWFDPDSPRTPEEDVQKMIGTLARLDPGRLFRTV